MTGASPPPRTRSEGFYMRPFHGFHGIVDDALVKEKRLNRARLVRKLAAIFFQAAELATD
jgi:hypothetical protein